MSNNSNPNVHGDVEGEVEEAVIANPGELQVGGEDQHEAMDLKRMTRSISSYHSLDTLQVLIIPSRIRRKPLFVPSR